MSSIMKGIQGEQALDKTQPEVQVPGYGTMPLDMLKRHVQSLSKEFNDSIQQGEFLKAAYRTEQFYNALMALAKALKQQGVSETISTGLGGGSAGIGGGAGLGIDKSPMEKVLEKPLGEGNLPPKAGFNKNPHKVGPGTHKDDYEYKKFIPRDRKEKGEEWAIARDVKNVNSRLGTKKPKELKTDFYKNYLNNRPVREEEIEETIQSSQGGMGQSYRKFTPKSAGLDEEQAPMFTPEEKIVNMNDPGSDGWRVYKAEPAGSEELDEISNFLALKQRDAEFKKIFGTTPLYKQGERVITKFSDRTPNFKGTIVDFDIKTRKATIKDDDDNLYFVHAQNLEKVKESSIMKGLQTESTLSEVNPVNVWATMSGRGQGGIPADLRVSEIPIDQIGSRGLFWGSYKDTVFYNIMSGNAFREYEQEYKKKGKEPDVEKIKQQVIKLAKAAGLEQDADGKWYFDVYTPMTKERKSHMTYLEYNFGRPYDKKDTKSKKESTVVKGLQTEASGVTRWSKENPPPPELLLNTLIQILMNPANTKSPQDLISLWNDKYGLKHTLGGLKQYAQNDYKKAELSKALTKAALAYESSEGK